MTRQASEFWVIVLDYPSKSWDGTPYAIDGDPHAILVYASLPMAEAFCNKLPGGGWGNTARRPCRLDRLGEAVMTTKGADNE